MEFDMVGQTITQFKAIDSTADLIELVQGISKNDLRKHNQNITEEERLYVLRNTSGACHICSGQITSVGDLSVDWFGSLEHSLAAHANCYKARGENSPSKVAIAIKMGFWAMMRAQKEEQKSWVYAMIDSWIDAYGNQAGLLITAPRVPHWEPTSAISTRKEFVTFVRSLFVYEREAPKFENQDLSVPSWDPSVDWKVYKRYAFMPAYNQLKRLNDRTLLKDKTVLDRTGSKCALCKGEIVQESNFDECKLAKDHIFPFSKGGSDCIENLQPLHRFCNGAISSVGVGEIPLSLQMGHWLIEKVQKQSEVWVQKFTVSYAKHLRSSRISVERRRIKRKSNAN
jgi:hypothetical protein